MAVVTGTVAGVPAIRTHTSATDKAAGKLDSGKTTEVQLGNYANTGNVDQTVTFTFTDVVNCEPTFKAVRKSDTTVISAQPVVLKGGESCGLFVNVKTPVENIGDPDQPFSFTVVDSWS